MLFELPLAYFGGVRVVSINETSVIVKIKHRWFNQNPFKSMFSYDATTASKPMRKIYLFFRAPKDDIFDTLGIVFPFCGELKIKMST
mgnify:CR=1 FL=1